MNNQTIKFIISAARFKGTAGSLLIALVLLLSPWWWPWVIGAVDTAIDMRRPEAQLAAARLEPVTPGLAQLGLNNNSSGRPAVLEVTTQSLKNLGLTPEYLKPIELTDFYRTLTVPAMIVAKPGRTELQVSSPMIGIVQHVHAVSGEAVEPGELLFEVRLTYEDLVDTQTQLLKNLSDLEIEQREVTRLEEVTRSGAVANKLLLERQYALQKLTSSIDAQRAALKLHGLSDEQINLIIQQRRLLRDLAIVAPNVDVHTHDEDHLRLSGLSVKPAAFSPRQHISAPSTAPPTTTTSPPTPLIVERLGVSKGQGVQAGEVLCTLSDYAALYIEGQAFEQEAAAVAEAAAKDWPIEAVIPGVTGEETLTGLKLAYVANSINAQSRTLPLYVDLPNAIVRDVTTDQDQRFISWKYRVGQRLELRVPIELWQAQIVLPVEATVQAGADWFVFKKSFNHFTRVAVHVKYRDQRHVVIENDGAIVPGNVIAWRSAHQMQLAIINQASSAADPHAGHNH